MTAYNDDFSRVPRRQYLLYGVQKDLGQDEPSSDLGGRLVIICTL